MEGGALDARRRIEPEHVPEYVNENGHGHANGNEHEHVNEKNLLVCVLVYVPVLGLVPVYVSVLVPVYGLVLGLGLDPPIRENSRKFGLAP